MTLADELLCVADTKLVMGNWLAETVMNGRSLPDYAAMLGMCTTSFGQTRALYQFLAPGYEAYSRLERGRDRDEICSMNLLDAPPRNWEDQVLTIWLAERATWTMMSGFLDHPDRRVAALARKIGEEAYFHLKYASGWFRLLVEEDESRAALEQVYDARLPLAADWFGPTDLEDPLHAAGERAVTPEQLRTSFLVDVAVELKSFGMVASAALTPPSGDWRDDARRRGPLPEGLFEVIRFKDPALAH
ncbi:Phenylacetic acid catabolic protein [Pseudonocardia xishanensis]|uniref:Ring-1,2-phenylacetyl-CoA epoxidase subunit PaaC n=1 Tax=Pseudonocardia xishanensis TaxID=630995 RepID=A0ABP8RHR2_9PSEU